MAARLILKKNEEFRVKSGHLWVFSNEIFKTEGDPQNGDLAELYDSRGSLLGSGFYNKNSLISFRLLSRGKIDNLQDHFTSKIKNALDLRKAFYPERNSFRLAFSESDFLPGLIIDKYNNTFVLQVYSYGMEKNIELIVSALRAEAGAVNVFSKNEEFFRQLEGLPAENSVYLGEMKSEVIDDGKIKYRIDFEKGHKTGFYFDQCDNRTFIESLAKGREVLDAFCNSGGFGLHAAAGGAAKVTFLDSSASEIQNAEENMKLNGFNTEAEYTAGDVFDYLEASVAGNRTFDIVMIDPPAFAKNKKSLPAAKKGYEKLNRLAILAARNGGWLVTSSCSHHLKEDEFMEIVNTAALKAGKQIQMVHFNNASLDHPQLPAMNETVYLKFAVFRVTSV